MIAAQNPYDDVGTVRISRAFMDRICLIRMDYQSEGEEREIVRMRTGSDDNTIISLAVQMVRATREHDDIKMGASVRAAIDMVDLYSGLRKLSDRPRQNILLAARMALSNKIWLNEMTQKTADEIIEDIWNSLEDGQEPLFRTARIRKATKVQIIRPMKFLAPRNQTQKKKRNSP